MSTHQVPLPPGSERMRTNWTPSMERYFIDLMLDQMHRGNRMGHTFNKQAWTDMLNLFNAKFGSKYDRDVLKSHYSSLWKQYNEVKVLLEQTGFSWDDTRKIVVADDHVWDAFIKTNPDSQCYRRKSLMNFNDLCLIYAYTMADGRYSRSSHDVDVDDDIQGLNIGSLLPTSTEHDKKDWTPAMDRYFIELMLDQLKKRNKKDMTFSKQAWKHMVTLFNENFGYLYSVSLLKRRYKKLYKYYSDMTSLLERRGFSWDERQQLILADDEVWEKCIKAHPDANPYRGKTLLNYQDLSSIYGKQVIYDHQDHVRHNKNLENGDMQIRTAEGRNSYSYPQSNGFGSSWTPSMDRYLIDLLQDQALRGNKIGQELTMEAWNEMIRLFSDRFGSHHDKVFLKNQYKHLRSQYNGINFLLEQNGFSWDENREMITAEDHIWDSIIKVHPDASLYRNKSVPSYHKLCVIFGEENSKERYSLSAHDADLDGACSAFTTGDNDQCHANGDCSLTEWTPMMDRYFIDLMLEQVARGKKTDCSSDDQAWIDTTLLFKEKFELKLDKDFLKSYYESSRNLFIDMKNLLGQRGFSWDETQQLVTAHDNVWDTYIKENPDVRLYRGERMPNYNDLCLIYGNSNSDNGGNQFDPGTEHHNSQFWSTDWTPPMDRFFIDLMLKHVRQGSMVNLRFSRQAWSNMVEKLNAEFGSQHDKDVFKNRFMNLRKRFIDMNNLLGQKGFAWDERKQMIIANADLWNSYVKEYPDSRAYYNRALPNYNDLFLIFGDSRSDGIPDSGHSIVADDDHLADDEGQSLFDDDPPQTTWTKSMEVYFIELLLEQVFKGNKIGPTFNEQAWAWIVASFNNKFGLLCDKEDVESWYSSLMEEYNNITDLLMQKGFAWDRIEQRVIANDDDWKFYLEENPGAIKYRDRIVCSYIDLSVIFGNEAAPIRSSRNSSVKMVTDNHTQDMGLDSIFGDKEYQTGEFEISDHRKKRKPTTSSTSVAPTKVQRQTTEYPEVLYHKPRMIKMVKKTKEKKEHMSIEVIVNALQTIPDMDDELFLEACQLLEDEKKATVFVGMDVNGRRKWLYRKLHRQHLPVYID
ncbi:uncharacterized protein LOC126673536 [Mercurialis annua]|uniref:uncharacterized protein LOC126673536 n=1 Tax=Mercurialis annua TaxID=3986 RepID=UPI00216007B5|nr:uncharacterized protein LOC126673536 [Mercurialis annua]